MMSSWRSLLTCGPESRNGPGSGVRAAFFGTHRKRLCLLLIVALSLLVLTKVVDSLFCDTDEFSQSHKLTVTFLGYTNTLGGGNAAWLRLTNASREPLEVIPGVTVRFLEGSRYSYYAGIGTYFFWLRPHSSRDVAFTAPTNDLWWCAEVGFVGKAQMNRKASIARHLPKWDWLRKSAASYLALRQEHARTTPIEPANAN